MTTNEEFQAAIKLINSCIATIESGCKYNQLEADWLEYKCRCFHKAYLKRIKSEV